MRTLGLKASASLAVVAALVSGTCLVGCSSAHEVIESGKSCTSCHSDEKQTYDVSSPSGALSSNGTLTVKTSSSSVLICKPTFISSDGTRFVPEKFSSVSVSGGSAEVTLDEGTWVLCTADGVTVQKSKVVVVSSAGDASAEVDL